MEQRLRADLDREAAAERRLAAEIADLEQRMDAVRRDTAREDAEAAAKAADLEAAIREREATALQAGGRIADLRERLQAAQSLWDGVQKPEVGACSVEFLLLKIASNCVCACVKFSCLNIISVALRSCLD